MRRKLALAIIIIFSIVASAVAINYLGFDKSNSQKIINERVVKKSLSNSKTIAKTPTPWNEANVKNTIHKLSNVIGVRVAGSRNEHRAAKYIEKRLTDIGYKPKRQSFKIANGKSSYNIIAQKAGASTKKFILGAHYDTVSSSPGANDNGSGVAALLELARVFVEQNPRYTLVFVLFGSEEKVGSNSNNHHLGSRYYVSTMNKAAKDNTAGMVSVDMVGYGSSFHVRNMKKGKMGLVQSLLESAKDNEYSLSYLKDPGATGWSDHEAFELAGISAAWLEWRDDPSYHSSSDNYAHMQWVIINSTGQFLQNYLD